MMDLIKRRSSYRKTLFDFEKEVYFLEIKLKLNNFKKKNTYYRNLRLYKNKPWNNNNQLS